MILLDATTKSLEVKLGGVVTFSELSLMASYVDINQSTIAVTAMGSSDATTNGSTAVTAVAAPGASTSRQVKSLSIFNADTVPQTARVQLNDNSTICPIVSQELFPGETLLYDEANGWTVSPIATTAGATGAAGAQGTTGLGVPGEDGDDGVSYVPGPPGPQGPAGSAAPAGPISLLKANSGTDSTASATNVDTVAISGLTAKDTILVYLTLTSVTQSTAQMTLYNNTDGVIVCNVTRATLAAGNHVNSQAWIRQEQSGNTAVLGQGSYPADTDGNALNSINLATFTTAWTGSWTLALRTGTGGVTAGGTLQWSWAVYKVAGQ